MARFSVPGAGVWLASVNADYKKYTSV